LGDGWERWLQWPINEVIRTDIVNRKWLRLNGLLTMR
jgi:hypothetical protein